MPLSDITIRTLKPVQGRTLKKSDGGGLQLWVHPTGSKIWALAYRFEGKQRKLTIGPYPVISLKEARERRDEAKKLLLDGKDPHREKNLKELASELERTNTFELVAKEVIQKKGREGKSDVTLAKNEWLIGLALPAIGHLPISEISAPEILEAIRPVEARGRHDTARRMRALIGEVFRYAVATGRAKNDPTPALKGALTAPKVRHRSAIIDPKPFGGLLRAIDGYDGTPEVRTGLKLLALTFVRPGEMRFARWSEFDFEKAIWSIPAERMKMRRPHRVPLAPQTLALLEDLQKISGRFELLIPGAWDPRQPISENTFNAALRRMGYPPDEMTAHGFRASASSILNESGKWQADAIEAQLAHVEGNNVRRAYARAEYWEERVRMMAYWADRLDAMRKGAEIVQLRA